ncbi:very short patch repair endonuclease [Mucilaginibacter sp. AK015]|uniref:very short patch repair endonuclease n=1 Tax=Mucilaginibacter sp. AK015 TaxID=2723072 RepID=UPI00161D0220|nr:DNA mismatch endonuclease Vsr [Mucilaginibacter sp. AK015]MBB5396699.1 DNA mismatch endonuclease (patch repair protein) [Mucilaginibacter sp. AK015]
MTSSFPKGSRSYNMSRIKSTDTRPEMLVRRYLFAQGLRYRLHDRRLPGKPDIVLPKYKTVIHIHGCFWHSHAGCVLNRLPKSKPEYWIPKLQGNANRDAENSVRLKSLGWRTLTVWECELKPKVIADTLASLLRQINS